MRPGTSAIDLAGKRFGRWIVLERITQPGIRPIRWNCRCDCGTVRTVNGQGLRRGRSKSCGCYKADALSERMTGLRKEKHPGWRGGRSKRSDTGYVTISTAGGKREHRLVMEAHLGRELLLTENVHHKNGVRDDNRLENLELWVTKQPPGQRPEDLVVYANEILEKYGDTDDQNPCAQETHRSWIHAFGNGCRAVFDSGPPETCESLG